MRKLFPLWSALALILAAIAMVSVGEEAETTHSSTSTTAVSTTPIASEKPAEHTVTKATVKTEADEALLSLIEGNVRFSEGKATHPRADADRLMDTAKNGQHPFAIAVSCSDSRVPVETVFDQGVGDVFVIRVAGNVCNTDETGSVEYAAGHLKAPLCVVIGHTSCGAVTAAVDGTKLEGCVGRLVSGIGPAVDTAKRENPGVKGKDLVPAAIVANVWLSVSDLFKDSSEIRELVRSGKLQVVGAVYDIESGEVRWLGKHPDQEKLLKVASSETKSEEVK